MARYGEVKQRQHFYHHGDTICHPKSQLNCTERLHVDATIMRFFQTELFSSFLRLRMPATLIWPLRSIGSSCQTGKMAALLYSLFFVFKMLFLPKYRVIYYDYIVKWCSGMKCNWCVSLDIYTTKIDGVVCPPNISETVAVRTVKLAHRPCIASTTIKFISKPILLSIL